MLDTFMAWLYGSSWLWGPYLALFIFLAFKCRFAVKMKIYKITVLYYIPGVIALQLLFPASQLGLRTMFFDLGSRLFLFVQGAEQFWLAWEPRTTPTSQRSMPVQQRLMTDEDDEDEAPRAPAPTRGSARTGLAPHHFARIGYLLATFAYLIWLLVGVAFAFTLIHGK